MVGTRDPEETASRVELDAYGDGPIQHLAKEHPEVELGTLGEAAAHGDLVIKATAGTVSLEALDMVGEENLNGRILVDLSNPLDISQGMLQRFRCRTRAR